MKRDEWEKRIRLYEEIRDKVIGSFEKEWDIEDNTARWQEIILSTNNLTLSLDHDLLPIPPCSGISFISIFLLSDKSFKRFFSSLVMVTLYENG